ncbi:hypothetical protein TNIN_150931 [Trichonephila inaurata madagascariensis]|uniref:Uncharacterized protein n=1 Tax=Trichonephila inaurata madagascariensis TaxID=2747483 RepID=A0A8X7CBT9_9ARAC|nr:hypothetical protein TNIN_150931 [Trichonephila inaurata madagascariensis]
MKRCRVGHQKANDRAGVWRRNRSSGHGIKGKRRLVLLKPTFQYFFIRRKEKCGGVLRRTPIGNFKKTEN